MEEANIMEILDEEARAELGVREIRKLLEEESSLNCPTDFEFLVRFVRARKYNVEAAFRNLKLYYGIRLQHPKSFLSLYPSKLQQVLDSGVVSILKYRDEMKRKTFVFRVALWNPELFTFEDITLACMMAGEEMSYCQESQKVGAVVIVDHEGLSLSHAKQLSVPGFRKLLQLFQDCFPAKYKAIHLVNQPYLFDFLFGIAKRFMIGKIRKRIHFHPDYDSLTKIVSPSILSESLGGNLPESEAWDDDLMNRLYSRDKFYKDQLQYGYKS